MALEAVRPNVAAGLRLDQLRRLTARDRLLLSWLAEHYVLTTTQITQTGADAGARG